MISENVTPENHDDLEILNKIGGLLSSLDNTRRRKILNTLLSIYGTRHADGPVIEKVSVTEKPTENLSIRSSFSEDRTLSPKEFMLQKQPASDVEKVACLAYYLAHFQNTPHFKTIDISRINTDAAQVKFSNAAHSVENATKMGYLVPAQKGNKQISALGEVYVRNLPDREAAKHALSQHRPKLKRAKR